MKRSSNLKSQRDRKGWGTMLSRKEPSSINLKTKGKEKYFETLKFLCERMKLEEREN